MSDTVVSATPSSYTIPPSHYRALVATARRWCRSRDSGHASFRGRARPSCNPDPEDIVQHAVCKAVEKAAKSGGQWQPSLSWLKSTLSMCFRSCYEYREGWNRSGTVRSAGLLLDSLCVRSDSDMSAVDTRDSVRFLSQNLPYSDIRALRLFSECDNFMEIGSRLGTAASTAHSMVEQARVSARALLASER